MPSVPAPTVLVVTARVDYTADMVVSELNHRGMPVLRLDPADDEPIGLDTHLTKAGWVGTISQAGRTVDLHDIEGILWRWAWAPPGDPAITDAARREWAAKEDQAAIFGVLKTLPVRWINHPDRVSAANSKPAQLVLAEALGFPTPRTLITHSGVSAATWAASAAKPDGVLYKAFFCHGIDEGGMVPASRVELANLPDGTLYAASMFQDIAEGQSIRVTVVGERMFAAAVDSPTAAIDWRPGQQTSTLREVSIPAGTAKKLLYFMQRVGLEYGAFDFIEDSDGTWWFLEINPTGQYGFVEIKTGLGISAVIADRLCQPVERTSDGRKGVAE